MNFETEYTYSFANASLTLRVIEYLRNRKTIPIDWVTVINFIDSWLVKVKMKYPLDVDLALDLKAFFNEMGIVRQPPKEIDLAFARLEAGESPTDVMNRYRVVIVAHGKPEEEEIEVFREQIIERLGYCPQNMA